MIPQVSRDLCVPEAKGLCHLVLLEAKVPTGWKHRSQKLLHCPSIRSAITGLEDLESDERHVLAPSAPSRDFLPRIFLCTWEADSLLLGPFHLSYFSSFYSSFSSSSYYYLPEPCAFSVKGMGDRGGNCLFSFYCLSPISMTAHPCSL